MVETFIVFVTIEHQFQKPAVIIALIRCLDGHVEVGFEYNCSQGFAFRRVFIRIEGRLFPCPLNEAVLFARSCAHVPEGIQEDATLDSTLAVENVVSGICEDTLESQQAIVADTGIVPPERGQVMEFRAAG